MRVVDYNCRPSGRIRNVGLSWREVESGNALSSPCASRTCSNPATIISKLLRTSEHRGIRRDLNAYRERQSDSYDCHDRRPDDETEIGSFLLMIAPVSMRAMTPHADFVWKLSLSLVDRLPNG
jgi:hypothetical protein